MDPATAVTVAAIAALFGIVQAAVQGLLTSRGAAIAARQDAIRAAIELCDRLASHVTDLGQAANEYGLNLSDEFMEDWPARKPLIRPILVTHGKAFSALAALQPGSAIREPVARALEVATALPSLGRAPELNAAWSRDRHAIPEALEALGRERAYQWRCLEVAGRPWWVRRRVAVDEPDR